MKIINTIVLLLATLAVGGCVVTPTYRPITTPAAVVSAPITPSQQVIVVHEYPAYYPYYYPMISWRIWLGGRGGRR